MLRHGADGASLYSALYCGLRTMIINTYWMVWMSRHFAILQFWYAVLILVFCCNEPATIKLDGYLMLQLSFFLCAGQSIH
jgi:hypothetical protein